MVPKNNISINGQRLMGELEQLATYSDAPAPAVTRVLLTKPDIDARQFFEQLCVDAGLEFRSDASGNLFARFAGTHPELPAVATGSHCDAIPHSGRYDGTVGVLGGLEAIRALKESGLRPRRSIELIMFTAEEPTRYGIGCIGSRLLSGVLAADAADQLTDNDGTTFSESRATAGYAGPLTSVPLNDGSYAAFVELHIEQGPLLENDRVAIGVVTNIAAPAALRVTYTGTGGHAGAVLMADRRDALLPASELALEVAAAARETSSDDTVATTGVLDVFPRAINSIPSRTVLEIDIRDVDLEHRDQVLNRVCETAQSIGDRYQQKTSIRTISQDPPASCASEVVTAIEKSCQSVGVTRQRMISRAYHDCLFMALICPSSMIFIPCRDGVSHRPDEYAKPEDIEAGVHVLAHTLNRLAE